MRRLLNLPLLLPDFSPDAPYRLSEQVGLRPEPFGALAYHFSSRRLVFLKTNDLVEVVRSLAEYPSVHAALEASELVAESKYPSYLKALGSLAESGVIEPQTPVSGSASADPTLAPEVSA